MADRPYVFLVPRPCVVCKKPTTSCFELTKKPTASGSTEYVEIESEIIPFCDDCYKKAIEHLEKRHDR